MLRQLKPWWLRIWKGLISTIITELIKFRVPCCRGGNQTRDKSWWKFEVFPGLKGSVRVKKKKHPGANATSKFKFYPALARKPKLWGWIRYVCLSGARYKRERHLFVILILLQDIASHPKFLNLCHKSLCYLQVSAWILKTVCLSRAVNRSVWHLESSRRFAMLYRVQKK